MFLNLGRQLPLRKTWADLCTQRACSLSLSVDLKSKNPETHRDIFVV